MRDFIQELKSYEPVLGFDPSIVEQGTPEWHLMRAGVITASKADALLAKKGTAKRDGYMAELVAQVCTGVLPDEINAKALNWGKENEDAAREAYSAKTFEIVETVPFIYKDELMRVGCSPDGICSNHGLELKSPWATRTHIEFICADKIKPEYIKQCQYSMWVADLDLRHFASFDPRMTARKLNVAPIERDEKVIKQIEAAAAEFIADMDLMLKAIGVEFGNHWKVNQNK